MRFRSLAVAVAVLLVGTACGGTQDVYEVPPGPEQQRDSSLPDPVAATPVFLVSAPKALSPQVQKSLSKTPGVAVVAPISAARLKVRGPEGVAKLRVGAVEPLVYRSVSPPATRDAEFVWISLVVGHAVPTFDAAAKLGVEGSATIDIAGTPGFQVEALADNGAPNVVDVLVQNGAERQLPLDEPRLAVVGAKSGVTIQRLARDLRKVAPGIRLKRLHASDTVSTPSGEGGQRPVGYVQGGVVGSMRFEILEDGFIRPDPSWVSANIVSAQVPVLGSVRCHRLLVPRLQAAMQAIVEQDLANLIRPGDFGGCYVPRFIDRDPDTRALSKHAFGLAVDINVSTNQLGTRGDMDPRIVAIFERLGFVWGGRWSRPDPMHFEL